MEIRNLLSFIQTAELGSFTRAAEKLGYNQSSISAQIKQLEQELGVRLFDRVNHTIKLTAEGKEILNLAHQLVRLVNKMERTADRPHSFQGHIRIAIAASLCHWMFRHGAEDFHHHFPGISLQIISASTEEMFRLLNQNEADLVYTLDKHIYDRNYVVVSEEPVACHFVAGAEHPLALKNLVTIKELVGQAVVLTEKNMSYRKLLDEYLASKSMAIDPFLEIGDTSLIPRILERGTAISYLPDYVTEDSVEAGKLVHLKTEEMGIEIWKQLLYHRNKWVSPEMQAVIRYLGGEITR